jgi:RNA polymerase sigma-70 factor (ECF subfamily)
MLSIVEELRTNRESGARRLEAEYKAGLMTIARRLCADEGDAEELVNSTFADVIEGIDDYLEQSAFFGWMCKILENRFAKEKRRKSNRTVVADGGAVNVAVDEDGAERIFQGVDAALLRDAIDGLPDEMKEALMLRYFMGLPVTRVAKLLSVPEGTAKWRLHCARMILAAKLDFSANHLPPTKPRKASQHSRMFRPWRFPTASCPPRFPRSAPNCGRYAWTASNIYGNRSRAVHRASHRCHSRFAAV